MVALVALAVVTAAVAAPAAGAATKVRSKITIGVNGHTLKGKVKSRRGACRKHRKVLVFRGHHKVGKTKSSRRGKWHFKVHRAGRYHAVAKRKKHHSLVCKRAKSRTVTVGGGGGGTSSFATLLTIRFRPPGPYSSAGGTFSGTVGSSKAACISGRTVKVFRQGSSSAIGTDTSNSSGQWHITAPATLQPGTYFAATQADPVGGGTCKAAQSSSISAP